jgi:hypothetical protein
MIIYLMFALWSARTYGGFAELNPPRDPFNLK